MVYDLFLAALMLIFIGVGILSLTVFLMYGVAVTIMHMGYISVQNAEGEEANVPIYPFIIFSCLLIIAILVLHYAVSQFGEDALFAWKCVGMWYLSGSLGRFALLYKRHSIFSPKFATEWFEVFSIFLLGYGGPITLFVSAWKIHKEPSLEEIMRRWR